jgi:sulfite exporter TauE/SafE
MLDLLPLLLSAAVLGLLIKDGHCSGMCAGRLEDALHA